MIALHDINKTYRIRGIRKVVARDMNFTFPTGKSVALLGGNGAGKSSLLRMIAGTMDPDRGTITSTGSISWPVGFAGSFHGELTGAQNTRFVARIYGVDTDGLIDFVQSFADLGKHFHLPFRTYSAGMRARLAFGVSMGIPFDTYLIDEVTAVGDAAFRKKSSDILHERLKTSGAIVVSHSLGLLSEICTQGVFLENGRLHYFPRIESAIKHHKKRMAAQIWLQANRPAQ